MESSGESFDFFFCLVGELDALEKGNECLAGSIRKIFFAPLKYDLYFDFLPFFEELFCLGALEIKIVSIGTETDADTLSLNFFLFCFGVLFLFGDLILKFPEIENLADWWFGFGGNFHQI